MENKLFSKERNVINPSSIKPLNKLIASVSSENAVDQKRHHELLERIQDSFGIDNKAFHHMVIPLVHKVAKYCQKLPESSMYYAQLGGLFDLALNRTEAAMALMRQILVLDKDEKPSEEQRLWQYCLFSAAMLQGLGKLYTDYVVDVYDRHGYFIKRWQPLLESIVTVGKFYEYELLRGDDIDLRNSITPIIARRIMPKTVFERIMSNKEVFATWLALLREDKDSVLGPLAAILERANAIAIQRDVNNYMLRHSHGEGQGKRSMSFVDNTIDRPDREKLIGAEFINWIKDGLEKGKIILNKEPLWVEIREASVVLSSELLDVYMQEHKKLKNRVALQKAFFSWNLHLLTDAAKDSLSQKSENSLTKIEVSTAILPNNVLVYNAKTDKITKVSSLELINNIDKYNRANPLMIDNPISQLSTDGKWVAGDDNVAGLRNKPEYKV